MGLGDDGGGLGPLVDSLSGDGGGDGDGVGGIIRGVIGLVDKDGLLDVVDLGLGLDNGGVVGLGSLEDGGDSDGQMGGGGLQDPGVVSGHVVGGAEVDLLGDHGGGLVDSSHTLGLAVGHIGGGGGGGHVVHGVGHDGSG